jgi:hypothetical protein
MSDTTTTRPVPVTRQQLRDFMPPEPTDSGVARARAGARRLDTFITTAAAELDQYDRRSKAAAVTLADAAIDGDDLEPHVANLAGGKRLGLVAKLEQLRAARAICTSRERTARTSDRSYLAWADDCRQITYEWEAIMNIDTEDDNERLTALLAFVERHR